MNRGGAVLLASVFVALSSYVQAVDQNLYEPNAVSVSSMTAEQARANFLSLVSRGRFWGFENSRSYWLPVAKVEIEPAGKKVTIHTTGPHGDYQCSYSFNDLYRPICVGNDMDSHLTTEAPYFVGLSMKSGFECIALHWSGLDDAKLFADSLYKLAAATREERAGTSREREAAFQEVLRHYRAQSVKPDLPEEGRRFKVQAELAVKEKRYEDAIGFYEKGLGIAPWWPEGHFNRAILFGEQQEYSEAIAEMKKYLALEPHAPNAEAAQTRIYRWEGREQ